MVLLATAEPLFGGVASLFAPYEGRPSGPPGGPASGRGRPRGRERQSGGRAGWWARRWARLVPATMAATAGAVIVRAVCRGDAGVAWPRTLRCAPNAGRSSGVGGFACRRRAFCGGRPGLYGPRPPPDRAVPGVARLRLRPERRRQPQLRPLSGHLAQHAARWGRPASGGRRGLDGRSGAWRSSLTGMPRRRGRGPTSAGRWPATSTTGWPRTWRSSPARAVPAAAASTRYGGPSWRPRPGGPWSNPAGWCPPWPPRPAEDAAADVAQSAATAALQHGVGLSLDVDGGRDSQPGRT